MSMLVMSIFALCILAIVLLCLSYMLASSNPLETQSYKERRRAEILPFSLSTDYSHVAEKEYKIKGGENQYVTSNEKGSNINPVDVYYCGNTSNSSSSSSSSCNSSSSSSNSYSSSSDSGGGSFSSD